MLNDVGLDGRVESLIAAVTKVNIASFIIALDPARTSVSVGQALLQRTRHISTTADTRQENDLRVRTLRHRLHGLKVSDLHSRSRTEDISSLPHQLRTLDLGTCGDNLGFSDTLGLCGHGEGVLQLVGEDDVFDEHGFDLDAPAGRDVFDDLADALSNFLTSFDDILEDSGSYNMAECRLSTLNKRLSDVRDAKSCLMWRGNVVIDNGSELERNVVLGHADLLWDFDNLNLDIDLDESLGERVDLDETWVDGTVETAELCDETDVALGDRLVGVGAADAAGDGAEGADAGAETVD